MGQRPTRKGMESRGFEERKLELLLLGDCAVLKPHQSVILGREILQFVLRHVDLGCHKLMWSTKTTSSSDAPYLSNSQTSSRTFFPSGLGCVCADHGYERTQSCWTAGTWPSTKAPCGRSWRRGEGSPRAARIGNSPRVTTKPTASTLAAGNWDTHFSISSFDELKIAFA